VSTTHQVPIIRYSPIHPVPARKIGLRDPFTWLSSGWRSFIANWKPAVLFGGIFAATGAGISLFALSHPQLMFAFWSGFLLIAPILSMVIFHLAQRHDRLQTTSMRHSGKLLLNNIGSSLLLALLLALIMIAWIRTSTLVTAIYAGNLGSGLDVSGAFFSLDNSGLLLTLSGVGAVFAVATFSLLAWSMPMLARGGTDPVTAMASSVRAVVTQAAPMLLWGGLVAVLTLASMATFFVAFVVVFPWLGFATWEAYKQVFE
jgi:uncharacterized membrane protein